MSELITTDLVDLDLKATERGEATAHLAGLLAAAGRVTDLEGFLADVRAREAQMPTGIEGGIGIPHARSRFVAAPTLGFGRSTAGVDFGAHWKTLDFKAQVLKGAAPGNAADDAYGLQLHRGGYAELDWMATPMFGFLGRGELRDAFVWLGDSTADTGANRAYLTKSWRGVGGVRMVFNERVIFKAEYLHNGEYGGIPQIKNDMFTTSLLLIN